MSPPTKATPHSDPFDPFDWNTPSFDSIPDPEPMTLIEYLALHATVRFHRGTGTGPPVRYIGNVDYYSPEWLGPVGRARHTAYNYDGEEIVQENTTEDLSRPEGEVEKTFSGTERKDDRPKNCALKRKGESNAPNGPNAGTSNRAKTSSAPTASGTDVPSANTAISCTSKEAETAVEGKPAPHDSPSFRWDDFLELSPGRLRTATPSPARTEVPSAPRLQEESRKDTKSSSPNTIKTARIAEPPRSPQRPVSKFPESARKVVGIATPAPEPRPQPSLEIMQPRPRAPPSNLTSAYPFGGQPTHGHRQSPSIALPSNSVMRVTPASAHPLPRPIHVPSQMDRSPSLSREVQGMASHSRQYHTHMMRPSSQVPISPFARPTSSRAVYHPHQNHHLASLDHQRRQHHHQQPYGADPRHRAPRRVPNQPVPNSGNTFHRLPQGVPQVDYRFDANFVATRSATNQLQLTPISTASTFSVSMAGSAFSNPPSTGPQTNTFRVASFSMSRKRYREDDAGVDGRHAKIRVLEE